jgi:small subunit ribosomal protein S17
MTDRGRRKVVTGVVTSDKMEKTIVVKVERLVQHPKYMKYLRRWTHFKAHDENNEAKAGDTVEIMETRPLSKTKCWRLLNIVTKKVVV